MDEKTRQHARPLSKRAAEYLDRAGHPDNADTPERIAELFSTAGLSSFAVVIDAFYQFGGYVLPMGSERRFKVYRAKEAIRLMRREGTSSEDPELFRIPIGQSETIQAFFRMDGHGRIYEDDRPISDSLIAWIEQWASQPPR